MTNILVTGGAGYIGAHCCVALIAAGLRPIIFDNFVNSSPRVVDRIEQITGRRPPLVEGDVRDERALAAAIAEYAVSAVIHFAALKAVGESVAQPLDYYDTNVHGTLCLLRTMGEAGVKTLVFSSSATVYGDPASVPIRENFPRSATNPYGGSKLVVEDILADLVRAEPDWRVARLRYFNPFGAHESGLIGEDPKDVPNNLMPYVSQVAVGKREVVNIFGGDWPTPDGTGVRDYIHVVDLAEGHLAALSHLAQKPGLLTVNLGTGKGHSVLEMIKAFEAACGRPIPYRITDRRSGDIAECWADPAKAAETLGWIARRGIAEMCRDSWRWQSGNPDGYAT